MRVLAFSDLHMNARLAALLVAKSAEADLVIAAGDFCNMRNGLGEVMAMLAGMAAPVVAVPGNAESIGELRAAAPADWIVLHGDGAEVAGLRLFGLGYAVPETPFGGWSCDLSEEQAAGMLAECAEADILVLHSPPKGVADVTGQGMSVGSVAIREAIARIAPKLAVCGHIHDSWGERGQIGGTEVANLGPRGVWFDVEGGG